MAPATRRRAGAAPRCSPSTDWPRWSWRRRKACPWSTGPSRADAGAARVLGARRSGCWSVWPTSPAPCRSRRCWAPTGPTTSGCRPCARTRASWTARPTCAPCWPGHRCWPATGTAGTLCRTRYRLALRAAGARRSAGRAGPRWAVIDIELGAVVDNPIVVADGEVMTSGNFHGEPLAFAADMLAMALAELASISERRVDRMLDPAFSRGLPPVRAQDAGTNSGFMSAQHRPRPWSARTRCWPTRPAWTPSRRRASRKIMCPWAGTRCASSARSWRTSWTCLAVEVCCAAQGIDLRADVAAPSEPLRAVHAAKPPGSR